ncbi:MAG: hypothetical protein IKJ82_02220 [Oscillospiraceae bacterium]|nr:hypothetical protein [Oscillospiraceae bacterium]
MGLKIDLRKGTEAVSEAIQKTSEMSKKLSNTVQEKAKDLSEKNKNENYLKRLKKYNPLFPDVFYSESFTLPNMIVIVDDAVRKGIDVCEGAIGWLSNEKGVEILHLYDEEVAKSGIKFVPAPVCDTIYYVDRFDRNRFIQIDCIFSKAHEEKLAELKHIAHSLGAKKCSIEISESNYISDDKKKAIEEKISIPFVKVSETISAKTSFFRNEISRRSGTIEVVFEGSEEVKTPELKWFANDDTIKRLIEMRIHNINQVKSETIILEGSVSATMSKKTACAIDGVVGKIGVNGKANMECQATKENQSKLIFCVEF